jgi:hypothetical protein
MRFDDIAVAPAPAAAEGWLKSGDLPWRKFMAVTNDRSNEKMSSGP